MITGIIESKTLNRHISCECKCQFDGTKCNSNQWWNSNKCWCECKNYHICEEDYLWNPAIWKWKNLVSFMDDSAICDQVIESYDEEIKTNPTNFYEKVQLVKH